MSKSYEKVNYLLRLKKQIERKLIIESISKLTPIIDITKYRYIGFGSVYFADFILFHKYLNIKLMSSIDKEESDEQRFNFNKPFAFIDFKISDSSAYINTNIKWEENLFIWFDYDMPLSLDMIADIKHVSAKAKPLDIFIITIEAEPLTIEQAEKFAEMFGLYVKSSDIKKNAVEALPKILNEIINSSIKEGLEIQPARIEYLQLFNITYKDTKKMYTFGGIYFQNDQDVSIKSMLSGINFISHDENIVNINCPLLTPKEKIVLDSLIKSESVCEDVEGITGLNEEDINRYAKYYKYYPQYFESIY